jgi:hypothetical protein
LDIIELLNATKRETYIQFEIEKKSISDIASNRSLAEGTIMGHLEDAIINGLSVNFKRLHITLEDIDGLEQKLRKPPINSNISSLTVIKEQVPHLDWGHLRIMMALIKKKYGLCREEVNAKTDVAFGLNQSTLKIDIPTTSAINNAYQALTSPSVKRGSSDHDSSSQEHTVVKDKAKKKPKFM